MADFAIRLAGGTDFTIRIGGEPVRVNLGESTAEAARQAAIAATAAGVAQAASGPNYASTAAGLAATTDGDGFAVDNGNSTVTVYLNNAGAAVSQRTFPKDITAPAAAGTVGMLDGGTLQDHFDSDGGLIAGGITLAPSRGGLSTYAVFRNAASGNPASRVYATPPESVLGQTNEDDGVVSSFTAFMDDYDAQLAESLVNANWSGPHYRDGGVSAFVGPTYAPAYTPAGAILFNAKTGGNWWPFRPAAGLSVSERPLATAMQILPVVALPGPTFAGGGVYPTDRWRPGKAYSVGDIVHEWGRVYEVITAGTSGQTPPLHDGAGGANADAWDTSIKTTTGTLNETSSANITAITSANPAVITTSAAHGLSVGDPVHIAGVGGLTQINGTRYVASVPSTTTFTIENRLGVDFDSSPYGAYTSGGTVKTGFWEGTDGGGNVEYALIEQIFGKIGNMQETLLLGASANASGEPEANPIIGVGDGIQFGASAYLIADNSFVAVDANADGSGFTNNCGLHADFNGGMSFGYDSLVGLFARHNSTTDMKFNSVSVSLSERTKTDGATSVDIEAVNIVKQADTTATSVTDITGGITGQFFILTGNANTTLVHDTNKIRIPGASNFTFSSNDALLCFMRNDTIAQVVGAIPGEGATGGGGGGVESGATFPASPTDGDRYYRTDLREEFFYDSANTQWLSTTRLTLDFSRDLDNVYTTTALNAFRAVHPGNDSTFDLWIEDFICYGVMTGTGNWTARLKTDAAGSFVSQGSGLTIANGDANRAYRETINAVAASSVNGFTIDLTENSGSGTLYFNAASILVRRRIAA